VRGGAERLGNDFRRLFRAVHIRSEYDVDFFLRELPCGFPRFALSAFRKREGLLAAVRIEHIFRIAFGIAVAHEDIAVFRLELRKISIPRYDLPFGTAVAFPYGQRRAPIPFARNRPILRLGKPRAEPALAQILNMILFDRLLFSELAHPDLKKENFLKPEIRLMKSFALRHKPKFLNGPLKFYSSWMHASV
jgi:hypothetical protein